MATLQRHCAKYIYVVPQGLRELMSDISREVLRHQPEDLYTFIADYLDALIITRENGRVALSLVENITEIAETTVNFLKRAGLTLGEANIIVGIIQTRFREYLNRKQNEQIPDAENFTRQILDEVNMSFTEYDEVFKIVQEAYEQFMQKHMSSKASLYNMVDWRLAAKATIALYRKTGVTKYEANRAATLIKAAYKGYYTRRMMKKLVSQGLMEEEEEEEKVQFEIEESSSTSEESSSAEDNEETISKQTNSTEAIQETHITEAEETQATNEITLDEEVVHVYSVEDEEEYIYEHIYDDVTGEIFDNKDDVSPEWVEVEESIALTEETYTHTEQTAAFTEDTVPETSDTEG